MSAKIKVLAICGSTRKASSNLSLILAIANLSSNQFDMELYDGLTRLPHFNPDLDGENAPEEVKDFRQKLRDTEAILICTPEYAIGVPGSLKNAIDWAVSSMEFSQKPVALITASLSGEKAHRSLLGTLLIIESKMTTDTQLLIPFVKTKVTSEPRITDPQTLSQVNKLIHSLKQLVRNEAEELSAPLLTNDGVNSGS